jgi:hypothetical protein
MSIAEKLLTVAENEQKVAQLNNQLSECLGGGTVSENDVLDKIYEAGQKAEYDRFWDNYQENGKRVDYVFAFGGVAWKKETFQPKYDIKPTDAGDMFYRFNLKSSQVAIDMAEHLKELGITMDFSKCIYFNYAFQNAKISRLGTIDFKSAANTQMASMFYTSYLTTIDNMIMYDNTKCNSGIFSGATNLTNLTISGVIANNFTISACSKLTHDSLISIIEHLKDYSSSTTTYTCTLGTTNLAKLTDEEKAIATDRGWTLA